MGKKVLEKVRLLEEFTVICVLPFKNKNKNASYLFFRLHTDANVT